MKPDFVQTTNPLGFIFSCFGQKRTSAWSHSKIKLKVPKALSRHRLNLQKKMSPSSLDLSISISILISRSCCQGHSECFKDENESVSECVACRTAETRSKKQKQTNSKKELHKKVLKYPWHCIAEAQPRIFESGRSWPFACCCTAVCRSLFCNGQSATELQGVKTNLLKNIPPPPRQLLWLRTCLGLTWESIKISASSNLSRREVVRDNLSTPNVH